MSEWGRFSCLESRDLRDLGGIADVAVEEKWMGRGDGRRERGREVENGRMDAERVI